MNRRKILKWLGLAPIAAVAPAVAESSIKGYVTDGKSYPYSIYPGNFYGPAMTAFELAPSKAEGETVVYDEFSHDGTNFNPDGYECNDRGYAQYYEDKYWEAQRQIDELHQVIDVPEPPFNTTYERWVHVARTPGKLFIDGKEV